MSSELLAVTVDLVADRNSKTLIKNSVIEFTNATPAPFNTSLLAFNDCFQMTKFSVVEGGVFLRVSYSAVLGVTKAEDYADIVLGEFCNAFNLSLGVIRRTHVLNNETESIDIYYQLAGVVRNAKVFEQLAKSCPTDGFGLLVTRNLLGIYLQGGPDTDHYGIFTLEYTLTNTNKGNVWGFRLELGRQVIYQNEDHVHVSLNELLNHSGSITPSAKRLSQVFMYVGKKEVFSKKPSSLILNMSSPPYTAIIEEGDYMVAVYNLTGTVDDIVVIINISAGTGVNLESVCVIVGLSAACIASVAILVFVRGRRKRSGRPSLENHK
jgi:hypothetical protein